eukprot:CAMPEP_0182433772 /NCGR_PEP_ID=MMETSP1167-20130531/65529_1 /TAXON_ID=2988 /ORGANISM="Mallomonas Sp, Strain CCMP3275" /LENGTH=109 /DNA_ID=CAMNT_0024622885 /DNA_START=493 /DNA_END=822 /DNA_ORIENTATION=-
MTAAAKRAREEETKKERLQLVKKLTRDDESSGSEEEDGEVGSGERERDTGETDIMTIMGFSGFDSTKGKEVVDNTYTAANGVVSKHKKRLYRQYMNRRGGFNRPLQKMP